MDDLKQEILRLVTQANSFIPDVLEPDLAALDGFPNVPRWHEYETKIWEIGEQIRQILNENTKLRKDHQLQDAYLGVIKNKRSKRGRQSFFFLVSYKSCNRCSETVASQLIDDKVVGHAISALRKMSNGNFTDQVNPFVDHPVTWIRNEAKKYIEKFGVGA